MYLIDAEILKFYQVSSEDVTCEQFFEEGSYVYNWDNIEKLFPSPKGLSKIVM